MPKALPLPDREELVSQFEVLERGVIKRRADGKIFHNTVQIDGKSRYVHRIIWKILHDEEPPEVDHVSGGSNAPGNLRASTHSQNQMNRGPQPSNALGVKNVYWHEEHQRFRVRITANGRAHDIGEFRTLEEATDARDTALRRLHGRFVQYF